MNSTPYQLRYAYKPYIRRAFSLIEVLVAIAIAGVGIVSVVGFMYTVIATAKETGAETRVSLASAHFLTFLTNEIRQDWSTMVNAENGTFALPVLNGGTYDKDALLDSATDPGWELIDDVGIYRHTSRAGLYKIIDGEEFAASARVWHDTMVVQYLGGGGSQSCAIHDSSAIQVFVEMSWPLGSSYAQRKKWNYQTTLTRNVP